MSILSLYLSKLYNFTLLLLYLRIGINNTMNIIQPDDYDNIVRSYPFLSCIRWQEKELIGIVQNTDEKMMSFYDFNLIRTDDEKKMFLLFGDNWWNESNRLLPINIFMQGQMKSFAPYLRTFKSKEVEILFGPCTSLNNLLTKRIKRRQIKLVVKTK